MSPLIEFSVLALLFVVTFVSSAASSRARNFVVPFVVGITTGLFAVQLANIHVFTPIVIAWFLARAGRREVNLRWSVFALPLACAPVALTVFFGDLVVNPNLALQLMSFALCAACIVGAWRADTHRPLFLGLLTATTASASLGLLQVAHIVPTDLWHVEVSALGRPTGFYPEPDWLGMYAGVGVLLAWRLPLPAKIRILVILINLSALVLAFARAAWLGFGVAAAVAVAVWLIQRNHSEPIMGNGQSGRLRSLFFTLVALVTAVIALPDLRRDLVTRLSSTLTAQAGDVSAQARVEQNRTLSALADSAPWYGHGLSSSGRVGVSGIFYSAQSTNSVASNWALGLWVDSAWLSVPLLALITVLLIARIKHIEGSLLLVVLTSSFFSNAFFQPLTWTLLAVTLATFNRHRDTKRAIDSEATRRLPDRASLSPAMKHRPLR